MRVRDIIGLVLALILAVGVAFLTRFFLTKEVKPGQEVALKSEQIMKVLVAGKDLSPGDVIKPGDLVWNEWPKDKLEPSYLTEGTTTLDEFNNFIVRFPIHKSNPIVKAELINKADKGILAAVVAPGKRAVSIDVTAASADSGLIFPGDYVDVILSTTVAENNLQVGKSKTILKNIKVVAFDSNLAVPTENPKTPPRVATLEMTPAQAEVLMAAAKEGTITLSLHSLEVGPVLPEPTAPIEKKREDKKIILMRGKDKSEIEFQEK